jgi:sporulation protein YlmC with PRC-barrel domain
VRLSELLGLDVHTESGEHIGHVYDVRGELTPRTLKVTGIVVGQLGLFERLGLRAFRHHERLRTDDMIPWRDVLRADRRGIVVRDRSLTEGFVNVTGP